MTIIGTKRVTKKLPGTWIRLSGSRFFHDIRIMLSRSILFPVRFFIIFLIIFFYSCSSKDQYRRNIEQLNEGDDKYVVAVSIGEYYHLFPEDIKQLSIYAEILLQYGYFSECAELCSNILKTDKKNWHVYYTRAIAYSNTWEFSKSIRDFDTLFTLVSPNSEIIEQYNSAKLYNNIYRKILSVDSLIAITPANSELYLQRANLYLNMNEPLPASSDYQFCLDLAGFNPDVIYNKFRAEILLKDYDQAEKDIGEIRSEKVAVSSSLNPELLLKIVEDAKRYNEMIQQNPDDITGFVEMARIFTFLKMENEAVDYLKSAQKIQPDSEQIKYHLAIVYAMAGKTEMAKQLVSELENSGVRIPEQLKEMIK